MKMRSPIVAMLWENWRLTRVEAAQRTGLGIVLASAALLLFDASAMAPYMILLFVHCMFWMSISKLNGGRILDGYKPGFPLHLLYTRPVPTALCVGVAMAYDAFSCAALYLVSAFLVGYAFGEPLPLFSVAVWLVTFHLICTCVQWSTRNRVVQWVGSIVICLPLFLMLRSNRTASPLQVEFSLAEYGLMAFICVVALGLTVAGVVQQRRGGSVAAAPQKGGTGDYPNWLVTLFRFPCPTSSATWAQMWFELRSSGLPVLAIGFAVSMMIPLLFAISIPFALVRNPAVSVAFFSVPAMLLLFGGNAFGIRKKQGRTYLSPFMATQPYGSAQLAGLKMLVRTVCVLAALVAVGVSVWASTSLIGAWGEWMVDGKDSSLKLLMFRRELAEEIFGATTGYEPIALVVLTSIAVAMMVASRAAFTALRARYTHRVNIATSVLLLSGLALALLAPLAERKEIALLFEVDGIFAAARWILFAGLVFTTVYVFWSGIAERVLTIRYASGSVAIWAAFGAAWLTVLHIAGVELGGMSAINAVSTLSPLLLPLLASALAPWSLNRIRHM